MKLQHKTTLYLLIPAIILMGICAYLQFEIVNEGIIGRVDKQLLKEKKLLLKQLHDITNPDEYQIYKTLKSEIEFIEGEAFKTQPDQFYSSEVFDNEEQAFLPIRVLTFSAQVGDQSVHITIKKPLEETTTFIYGLVAANVLLFTLLLVVSMIINRQISKRIWRPFFDTLEKLEQFNLSNPKLPPFMQTGIEEFQHLNQEVTILIHKITRDYNNYKIFIENVSHELQTPLAVARAKLDLMIQSKELGEYEHDLVSSIHKSLNKLSRLNQSLILLLKIENNIFVEKHAVKPAEKIKEAFDNFEEYLDFKSIQLTMDLDEHTSIVINELLFEVLIDNLVKNSVKHNVQDGHIDVKFQNNIIVFSNSGVALNVDPKSLFKRFKTASKNEDSTGLGLAIVHQICQMNNLGVSYKINGTEHILKIFLTPTE